MFYSGNHSIRGIAAQYHIPESTLRSKLSGDRPIQGRPGRKTVLTSEEEELLVNYVRDSARRAHPVTKQNVMLAVQEILSMDNINNYTRDNFHPDSDHLGWWRGFRSRHQEVTFRTPETLSAARRNLNERIIRQWFSDVFTYFTEKDLIRILMSPNRLYNMDESGFGLSPSIGKVLAIKGDKLCFEEQTKNAKTNITVLCTVGADGSIPPPLIIYPRKRISVQMAEQFPKNYDFCVGKSEKGYITFQTFYEYIVNDFNQWLERNDVPKPVVIFTDWHETRNNYHLAKAMDKLGIIMIGLLPNTTHLLQPLDVACFKPLKSNWAKAVQRYLQENPDEIVTQINFAKVMIPLYYEKLTVSHIVSGFSKCGLYPFNADSPDYTKLQAAAAQKEIASTMFEGIKQGKKTIK